MILLLDRRRDDGNLMLLSGIIVTIAFIMTALTLAQVSSLERQAATQTPTTISQEWRFIHERLRSNINTSYTPDLSNATFADVVFPAITETFRSVEAEKGYDAIIRLADSGLKVNKTETTMTWPAYSIDGSQVTRTAEDDAYDGLIFAKPCRDAIGGPANGCVNGVLVSVRLSDGVSTIEEVMLFAVNFP